MKKNLWIVPVAALVFAGCSQDDAPGINENNDPLKIDLTLSSPSFSTKGTGVVGGLEGTPDNKWNNQTIYVTALNKEDRNALDNVGVAIDNKKATAQADNSLVWADGATAYFPVNHSFDFYAYHVDDAAVNTNANGPVVEKDEKQDLFVSVKIDGSQDLLAGKAVLTDSQKQQLEQSWKEKHQGTAPNQQQLEAEYAKAFSAYTARRHVQPQIQFKHVLTRFTFNVLPGADGADAVCIDSIGVESKQNAKFYFALNADVSDKLVVAPEETPATLYLKKRGIGGMLEGWPIEEFHPTAFVSGGTQVATPVGESLMVIPQDAYRLKLHMSQMINGKRHYFSYGVDGRETMIPHPTNGTFEAGKSYEVNLIVYGLQEVKIETSLAGWNDGGKTEIDTEE